MDNPVGTGRPNYRSDFPSVSHTSMTVDGREAVELFSRPIPQIAIEGTPYEITSVLVKKEWNRVTVEYVMRGEMQLKPHKENTND